jgi:hypothetical protein
MTPEGREAGMRIWRVGTAVATALVLLDLILHWSFWLLIPISALPLIAGYLDWRRRQPSAPALAEEPVANPVPAQPPALCEEQVVDILLPSQDTDYCFMFSATVLWSPAGQGPALQSASLATRAAEAIVQRASEITRQRAAASASVVRWELSTMLGEMKADSFGCVRAMADSVRLILPASDQERLEKLAAVRKDEVVWEHERRYEQSRRRYLSGDVLKDPGSAVVWWLNRNNDEVEKAVRDIGLLVQLCSAANNTAVPAAFRHLVPDPGTDDRAGPSNVGRNSRDDWDAPTTDPRPAADHFTDFLAATSFPDGPQRALFAQQVAMAAAANGRPDIAADLVRGFDPPCGDEDEAEPEPGDPSDPEQVENEPAADDPF